MTAKKHVVKVSIVGEEYTIRSDETPEHTHAVAEHVDRAIRRVLEGGNVLETQRAAILAMLQLTDELFKARENAQSLTSQMRELGSEVRRWLPPTKRGEPAA